MFICCSQSNVQFQFEDEMEAKDWVEGDAPGIHLSAVRGNVNNPKNSKYL